MFAKLCKWAISLLTLMLISHSATSSPLIKNDKEVVYFFSYHCQECYLQQPYISILDMAIKSHDVAVQALPLTTRPEWLPGARLFYLLSLSKENYNLSRLEREKAGFSIIQNDTSLQYNEKKAYITLFRSIGMKFTTVEFLQWWDESSVLLKHGNELQDRVSEELGFEVHPGLIRASTKRDYQWLDFNNLEQKDLILSVKEVMLDEGY
jgi:hypothetical protein